MIRSKDKSSEFKEEEIFLPEINFLLQARPNLNLCLIRRELSR
jgi:hypothetical protein